MFLKVTKNYTIKNIAIISLCTGLSIAVKYAFGFIPGFEAYTFLMIAFGVFMPLTISLTICSSSILLIGAIYGMGTWWVMYWFIFPTEVFLSWLLKKFIGKNNLIFGLWTGFWGFSIMFWYAIYDFIIFGKSYAIAAMSTAILPNTIEGIGNFIFGLVGFYPFKHMFKHNYDNTKLKYW